MKRTIILASTVLSLATAAVPALAQQTPQEQQQDMRRGDRRGPPQGTPQGQPAPAPQPVTPGQMGNPTRTPMPGQGQAYGHQDVNRNQYDGRQQQYGGDQRGNDRGGNRDARQDYRDGRQDNRQDRRDDSRSFRDYDYNRPDPRYGDYRPERYYRQGNYAPRALGRSDRIYRGGDGRYYCRRDDGTTGLVVGALGGGVLGNVIAPGGSKTLGTVLGGGLGALLGRSIDRGGASCR